MEDKDFIWNTLNSGESIKLFWPSSAPHFNKNSITIDDFFNFIGKISTKYGDLKISYDIQEINQDSTYIKYYSNTDQVKAEIFKNILLDNKIKAIWCGSGGFGANEMLYYLDQDKNFIFPEKRKAIPLIGFSDVTAIHLWLLNKGWSTLHGPMANYNSEIYDKTGLSIKTNNKTSCKQLFDILNGKLTEVTYKLKVLNNRKWYIKPIVTTVIGGNLSIIQRTIMTNFSILKLLKGGEILFLEDTMDFGRVFRSELCGLIDTGIFDNIISIFFGDMQIIETSFQNTILELEKFLLLKGLNIPIIYSPEFGHSSINNIIPFGTKSFFTVEGDIAEIKVYTNIIRS